MLLMRSLNEWLSYFSTSLTVGEIVLQNIFYDWNWWKGGVTGVLFFSFFFGPFFIFHFDFVKNEKLESVLSEKKTLGRAFSILFGFTVHQIVYQFLFFIIFLSSVCEVFSLFNQI